MVRMRGTTHDESVTEVLGVVFVEVHLLFTKGQCAILESITCSSPGVGLRRGCMFNSTTFDACWRSSPLFRHCDPCMTVRMGQNQH